MRWAANRHEPLRVVTFTERWDGPKVRGHFSWVVWVEPPRTLGQKPVVLATHTRGSFPPQWTS